MTKQELVDGWYAEQSSYHKGQSGFWAAFDGEIDKVTCDSLRGSLHHAHTNGKGSFTLTCPKPLVLDWFKWEFRITAACDVFLDHNVSLSGSTDKSSWVVIKDSIFPSDLNIENFTLEFKNLPAYQYYKFESKTTYLICAELDMKFHD